LYLSFSQYDSTRLNIYAAWDIFYGIQKSDGKIFFEGQIRESVLTQLVVLIFSIATSVAMIYFLSLDYVA
jgi:hypothetical protein